MFTPSSEKQLKDKVLILYFIHHLKGKLSRLELTELFITHEIFEYFIYTQHLNELIDKDLVELIETSERATYHITDAGQRTLELFQDSISPGKLKWAKDLVEELNLKLKQDRQLKSSWKRISEHNYQATLEVNESDYTILKIEMSFVNNEQAQTVCKVWKDKASDIYGNLVGQLMDSSF